MLTEKQIKEIKGHLETAQNPIFFFDNDPDGLCSFLLLQRSLGRGKGVPIRSFPDLTKDYLRRISELDADYVFILDKPVVSPEFLEGVHQLNIPVVWIDHHEVQIKIPDFVNYYNPVLNKDKKNEPVTYLCYQITKKKEDMWLAVAGSISDYFVPDFYDEFAKQFPEFAVEYKTPFDIFYGSDIGKIARIFSFALKDRTTNVIRMIKFLMKVKSPADVLNEEPSNYLMHKRFNEINDKHQKFLTKAVESEQQDERILFFQYGGDMSISADLSNELSHKFPNKFIVVVYVSGIKANISGRGEKVRDLILEAVKDLEDSRAGGHENAVGAQICVDDIPKFKENLITILNRK